MRSKRRSESLRLVGPRVELRPLTIDDWPAWREVRLRSKSWLEMWEPRPEPGAPDPVNDREAFRARCSAWDRQRHFDSAYGFGLFERDGSFLGEVSLGNVQRGPFQMAYLGYWIDEYSAGRGFVPEGVVLLMRYAFEDLKLHRLEAAIVPRNAPSRRVVEKLGLREEGIAHGFLQIQGVYEDHVRYAITTEEWSARETELATRFLA
jgi:ribosomal-protein-alanine N-acetyltransferase